MDAKFLISKNLYNLYNNPKYPKNIQIINSDKDFKNFTYRFFEGNIEYENEIEEKELFENFNILQPKFTMSFKKLNNVETENSLILVISRYRGEDENPKLEVCLELNVFKAKEENFIIPKFLNYIYLEDDNSVKYQDSITLNTFYGYLDSDISKLIIKTLKFKNDNIINNSINYIHEFLFNLFNIYYVESKEMLEKILLYDMDGLNLLKKITNKSIDFTSIKIFKYDYRFDESKLMKNYNLIFLKHINEVYIIIFHENHILERSEEETGFNKNELMQFLNNV